MALVVFVWVILCLHLGVWATDHHLYALSLLFHRPIFQFNTFYFNLPNSEVMQLSLSDTTDVHHLARRFRDHEEPTRTHMLHCSNPIAVSLAADGLRQLSYPPLTLYHVANVHWVAMLPLSLAVLAHVPIPTARMLIE